MGRNNRQRRAAKRRARSGRGPARPRDREEVAADFRATAPPRAEDRLQEQTRCLVERVFLRLGLLWERGWLPLDIVHAVRKVNAKLVPLAAESVRDQTGGLRTDQRAPQVWRDHWAALDAEIALRPLSLGAMQRSYQLEILARTLEWLPALPSSDLPPSKWGRTVRRTPGSRIPFEREKVLNRVRALLAKAEATQFGGEAELLTAKAQDLMTRHAIDEAMLHPVVGDVTVMTRRIHLLSPYISTKVSLLSAVGQANRTRVVHLESVDMASLVGTPVDVDLVELLFTSLLVQATRAMTEAGARRPGSFDRSATFRRAFLTAYAVRIGERLADADAEATASYGSALVPVLRAQEQAVQTEFERLFPSVRTRGSSCFDADGLGGRPPGSGPGEVRHGTDHGLTRIARTRKRAGRRLPVAVA